MQEEKKDSNELAILMKCEPGTPQNGHRPEAPEENESTEKSFNTEKLAQLFHVRPGTPRSALCRNGHWLGLVPIKLPNGRLIWPAEPVRKILRGGGMR